MYESYTTRVTYDRCIFIQYRSVLGFVIDGYAIVTNYIFDKGTTLGLDVTTSNVHIISNPVSFNLAHFSTDNVCIGEPNENAFGCNNGTCPSSMGCPLNAFSFQDSDAIYTEKLYLGYNTVRTITSNFFTESDLYTMSDYFSNSILFTKSNYFSDSFAFSNSNIFVNTNMFSESDFFSNSFKFTQTYLFSFSIYFTKSGQFSNSFEFSHSKEFLNSIFFSNSNYFSNSNEYTLSKLFTKSYLFSNSNAFTISERFTSSKSFSDTATNVFTLSLIFSNSRIFTKSDSFNPTPTQSLHSHFTTKTGSVSMSYVKVRSVNMTYSIYLSQTFHFTDYNGSQLYYETQTLIQTQIYYIIYILSPTYVPISISFEIKYSKKKITPEQLVGIVCGSVATFFLILAIVIFAVRKNQFIYNSLVQEESSSLDESQNDTVLVNVNFNNQGIDSGQIDNWL